jgi:glucose-1-phosphate thymidylyltransferase
MKAVILAAGEGKRLRPFTETMPKVMLPVANKPILEYVIDAVISNGINEIILVVGYKKEVIQDYFTTYNKGKIEYVIQDKQLGTGHALIQAQELIDHEFITIPGDNIIDHNSIAELLKSSSEHTMIIKQHKFPSKYGVVTVEKDKLTSFVEKPKEHIGSYIATGIYKFPVSIFSEINTYSSQGIHALSSVVENLLVQKVPINTIFAETWMDIVYPWNLLGVNETVVQQTSGTTNGTIDKGVSLKGAVTIGKKSRIYGGSYIVGPVIIGEGCEIGPNVCIFPSTSIGDNTVVQPFSEIHNSIIMNDTHIGSQTYISHSIIGRGGIIGSHLSTIPGPATLEIENEFMKLHNVGTMIGEDCTIGHNVVIEPGRIIGRNCSISSLTRVMKHISSGQNVI